MTNMDQDDEQDTLDSVVVERSMSPQAQHVRRLLRQGFRVFRVVPRGPTGYVLNVNWRHRVVEMEVPVVVRKGSKGQKLKKPRHTTTSKDFSFDELALAIPKAK